MRKLLFLLLLFGMNLSCQTGRKAAKKQVTIDLPDNKKHRFFPDFLIQTTKGWILIEVKPQIQTKPPKKILMEKVTLKKRRRYLKAVQTWLVNEAKWNAAKKVCEVEGWKWSIMTEKQLTPDK